MLTRQLKLNRAMDISLLPLTEADFDELADATSSTQYFCQRPPMSLNVGRPEGALIPAPVRTTTFSRPCARRTAAAEAKV